MSARAPTGQGLLPPHPVPLPPVQSLARAWPRLSPCPAGAGDLQLRVPVGAEGARLSSGTILPWPSGSAPQPLSSHRLCTGTNEHSCCLPRAARGVVAVGARRMYGGGAWTWLVPAQAVTSGLPALAGCSLYLLAQACWQGCVPHGRCQMLQPRGPGPGWGVPLCPCRSLPRWGPPSPGDKGSCSAAAQGAHGL